MGEKNLQGFLFQVRWLRKKLAILEIHHLYSHAVAPLLICLPTRGSNT